MNARQLGTPWAPNASLYSLPGSLVLKLRLGEAPDSVPSQWDVRSRLAAPATTIDGGVIDRLVRHYANGALVTRVHAAAASLGRGGKRHCDFNDQEHVCGLSRTFRLDMDRGSPIERLMAKLNEVSIVESAAPNYVSGVPFASAAPLPSPPIDMEQAWESRDVIFAREAMAYEAGDPGVIIGIIDSGVAPHHPDTARRFRAGFDTVQLGAADFASGITLLGDLTLPDTKPIDEFVGHGMGCAGIIGALGTGIPPGLAGDCSLMPIRVLGAARLPGKPAPVGIGAITDIDAGLKMGVELGAKALNLSFGTPDSALDPTAPKPHADVVRYALLRGCVLVAASGNSGVEELYWPAAYDGVIAVGSVGLSGAPSHFTTQGRHLAVCAVGERVATCALKGYQLATGTSFAAPFVTAAAALLVSRAQRRSYPLGSDDVRRLLVDSATPWPGAGVQGYGAGILNASAALTALDREIDHSPHADAEPDAPDITDA
jgi:subtilisin family serine protease